MSANALSISITSPDIAGMTIACESPAFEAFPLLSSLLLRSLAERVEGTLKVKVLRRGAAVDSELCFFF
jgi:hypothetical protein